MCRTKKSCCKSDLYFLYLPLISYFNKTYVFFPDCSLVLLDMRVTTTQSKPKAIHRTHSSRSSRIANISFVVKCPLLSPLPTSSLLMNISNSSMHKLLSTFFDTLLKRTIHVSNTLNTLKKNKHIR